MLTAVDIFAGGGGLTVGLKRAGFSVVGAVEFEPHAYATLKANHPEITAYKQDVRTISGEDLRSLSPNGSIDLVAGCPPCQGFSSLTSKYKGRDGRNALVREMARLVEEVNPHAVMMENVPGLFVKAKGKRYLNELLRRLDDLGYCVTYDVLQVADYGVPQSRRRLVLLAGLGFSIDIPVPTHSRTGDNGLRTWRVVSEAIGSMPAPVSLKEAQVSGGPGGHNWHVVRTLDEQNRQRLKHAKPGASWTRIPKNLRPACHQNRNAGFSNVYGRMRWDEVSPSITGGCTTLSKGRFGHPSELRTISVREAALLQTFPPDYIFDTPYMEYACAIVGNALPCDFATQLATACRDAIMSNTKS